MNNSKFLKKFFKLLLFSLAFSSPFCGHAMNFDQKPITTVDKALCDSMDKFEEGLFGDKTEGSPTVSDAGSGQVQNATASSSSSFSTTTAQTEDSTPTDDTALCALIDELEANFFSNKKTEGSPAVSDAGSGQVQNATASSSSSFSTTTAQTEDSTSTDDTALCALIDELEADLFGDDNVNELTSNFDFAHYQAQNATASSSSSSSTTTTTPNKKIPFSINGNMQCYFSSQDHIIKYLIEDYINVAKKSIYITTYCFSVIEIARALLRANLIRGVDVVVVCDQSTKNDRAIQLLVKYGIKVFIWNPPPTTKPSALMHHKFALFDDDIVWNGSFNWTHNANDNNCENVMVVKNQELYTNFLNEFNKLLSTTS